MNNFGETPLSEIDDLLARPEALGLGTYDVR